LSEPVAAGVSVSASGDVGVGLSEVVDAGVSVRPEDEAGPPPPRNSSRRRFPAEPIAPAKLFEIRLLSVPTGARDPVRKIARAEPTTPAGVIVPLSRFPVSFDTSPVGVSAPARDRTTVRNVVSAPEGVTAPEMLFLVRRATMPAG
jgi:hypothetical protein